MLSFDPNHHFWLRLTFQCFKVGWMSIEMLMKANSTHGWRQWHWTNGNL